MRAQIVQPTEVVVSAKRIADLERRAAANDAYVRASVRMRARQAEMLMTPLTGRPNHGDAFVAGWLDCLAEFCALVVEESRNG